MDHQTLLESAAAKLATLARAKGISIEDLVQMLESGAAMSDILGALDTKEKGSAG